MKLNLETKTKEEEIIKAYLEENASDTLAEKINNGTPYEKDGKQLINKKDLTSFMKFACDEAKKLAEKGAHSACIEDSTVFGWAIHYFEEDEILGTLYNLDGTKYEDPKPKVEAPTVKPVIKEEPKEKQLSLFDIIDNSEYAEQNAPIHNDVIDLDTGEIIESPTPSNEAIKLMDEILGGKQ